MTELVGIANLTPDSFSDGGQYNTVDLAVAHIRQLFLDGAALVDVGAESSRPGATPVTADEEWQRLEPTLSRFAPDGHRISIDTYHPETVHRVADLLVDPIINDVTGFSNPDMVDAVAERRLRCVISHLPKTALGNIAAAHAGIRVNDELQVRDELLEAQDLMYMAGIERDRTILDPGIGFGKTSLLSRKLIGFAALVPGETVMVGYSRKKFLGPNRLDVSTNLSAATIAVAQKTAYLRVHDVFEHRRFLDGLEG